MKAAVILTHPAPYREAVLKRIKEDTRIQIDSPSIFSCDFGHHDMGLGEDSAAIAADVQTLYPRFCDGLKVAWRLIRRFSGRKYDFVVWPAYAPWWLTFPVAVRAAFGRRYAIALDTVREAGGLFSRAVKSWFFRKADFLWVPGLAARKHLVGHYGVPGKKIVGGLYIQEFVPHQRRCMCSEGPVFLMVANNRPFRRMDAVADGFRKYLTEGGKGRLIFCGTGTTAFASSGIEAIEGVSSSELPELYSRADVYVHNGDEQFSVALLMGAMTGLPILAGTDVGAVADILPDDGSAGFKVSDWSSPDSWAIAFRSMTEKATCWSSMSEVSSSRAAAFNPKRVAAEVVALIAQDNH